MNRFYFSILISTFYLFVSCGQSNKTTVKSANQSSSQEPDIELAKFERVIAEKKVEDIEDVDEVNNSAAIEKVEPVEKQALVDKAKKAVKPKKKKTILKKKKSPKYAKIEFDSIVHRLPAIIEGDKFKDEFHFKNTGEVPLTISFATASCGCTLPSYPFLDIAPGDSDVIRVEYNSVGKDGPQEAEITVSANTYPKEMTLKMIFDVNQKEKIDTSGQE